MGTSAGGYGAILFGSICNNVTNVISFIPQTILKNPINLNYSNLRNVINENTNYLLYGDTHIHDVNHVHHISHCENVEGFTNVKILKKKKLRFKRIKG